MGTDRFGPTKFVVGNLVKLLPRAVISGVEYKTVNSLKLDKDDNGAYIISPFIKEDTFSRKEADTAIKSYIWNTFFEMRQWYSYYEKFHWPHPFCVYIKEDLKLSGVDSEIDVSFFISQIRNVVFKKMVYIFCPQLIVAATNIVINTEIDIIKQSVKMNNPHVYTISNDWSYWFK